MHNVSQQFSHTVDGFVRDLTELVRSAALQMAHEALQKTSARQTSARPQRRARAISPGLVPSVAKGQRRSTAALESVSDSLVEYISQNPGQRIEQIAKGLDVASKDLVLPVKRLLSQKKLSKRGERRSTTYFPA